MRPRTVVVDIYEEGEASGMMKMTQKLISLGLLTDEQIAVVANKPVKDIAALRHEMNIH